MRRRARASLGGWMQATRRHSSQLPGRPEKAPPCTNAALGQERAEGEQEAFEPGQCARGPGEAKGVLAIALLPVPHFRSVFSPSQHRVVAYGRVPAGP